LGSGDWVGKDCLYKYFLKGKQYQGDQAQLHVGVVSKRRPHSAEWAFWTIRTKIQISQEELRNSSSCSLHRDQNRNLPGKAPSLLGSRQGTSSFSQSLFWYPVLVYHSHTVGKVTWLNL
jgi:hypothetical protein